MQAGHGQVQRDENRCRASHPDRRMRARGRRQHGARGDAVSAARERPPRVPRQRLRRRDPRSQGSRLSRDATRAALGRHHRGPPAPRRRANSSLNNLRNDAHDEFERAAAIQLDTQLDATLLFLRAGAVKLFNDTKTEVTARANADKAQHEAEAKLEATRQQIANPPILRGPSAVLELRAVRHRPLTERRARLSPRALLDHPKA